MKRDFKVDKNSWHFKFINDFEHWDKQFYPEKKMPKDFCSYWAKFAEHVFSIVSVLVIFVGFVLLLLVVPFYMLSGINFAIYFVSAILLVGYFTGMFEYKEKRGNIFVMKYHAWKDKYCPMITYK